MAVAAPAGSRTGGQLLVDQLVTQGVDTLYCVPGESYLAALDALYDAPSIRLITCRQEGGAAYMAAAYGKLTGRPGVCFVTRGPGATNASIGIHTAFQDSAPLVLLVGQVSRAHLDREAFQEIDYRRMFGQMAKWVAQIDDPRRIPELVGRAFALAVSGRPGPVVLALPEDMLAEPCAGDGSPLPPGMSSEAMRYKRVQGTPSDGAMDRLRELLRGAHRPLMIVGGSDWTAAATADLLHFGEANNLPAAAAFRCQDLYDNRSPTYSGDAGVAINPALARRIQAADLLLVVGDRMSEAATGGYTLIDVPRPRQTLVHVYPDPDELGRVYQPDLPILSGMPEFAAAARALPPVDSSAWAEWTRAAHDDYLANLRYTPRQNGVDLAAVVTYLSDTLPRDAIITNGAGNYTVWCHRFYQFSSYRTQLAPTSGAMGYGVPAAVAAKSVYPQRIVVAFSGDGDFLMNGQELATAVQYELPIVILVANNGMYGTIRMHQERSYPRRTIGTRLVNPDFAAYAAAFGAYGEIVERTADFAAAFERALDVGRAAILELRTDPEAMTPRASLSAIREAATKGGS